MKFSGVITHVLRYTKKFFISIGSTKWRRSSARTDDQFFWGAPRQAVEVTEDRIGNNEQKFFLIYMSIAIEVHMDIKKFWFLKIWQQNEKKPDFSTKKSTFICL